MEILVGIFLVLGILYFAATVDITPILKGFLWLYVVIQWAEWMRTDSEDAFIQMLLFGTIAIIWNGISFYLKRRKKRKQIEV